MTRPKHEILTLKFINPPAEIRQLIISEHCRAMSWSDVFKERDALKADFEAYKASWHCNCAEKVKELQEENAGLRKVHFSKCPECGYAGCVRGRKACDYEIDQLKTENERLIKELKGRYELEVELSELREHQNVYNKNRKDLLAANAKLKSTIAELEEDLKDRNSNIKDLKKCATDWMDRYDYMVAKYEPRIAVLSANTCACGSESTHQCNFSAQEVCDRWLCDECVHPHHKVT